MLIYSGALAIGGLSVMMMARTPKSNGYWAESYLNDHLPAHVHLKGTDGTNIRIGFDGKPLSGEPSLTPQQRNYLKRFWDKIKNLFPKRG